MIAKLSEQYNIVQADMDGLAKAIDEQVQAAGVLPVLPQTLSPSPSPLDMQAQLSSIFSEGKLTNSHAESACLMCPKTCACASRSEP